MAVNAKSFDKPIVFAFSITLVVLGMIAIMSWAASGLGLTGPLGVLKGGVVQ